MDTITIPTVSVCICGGPLHGRIRCYEVARYDNMNDANLHFMAVIATANCDVLEAGWYPSVMSTENPYRPFVSMEDR